MINALRFSLALLGWICSLPAASQWAWVDQDGRPIFSDRPPPLSVPEKNILKRPKTTPSPADMAAKSSAEAEPPALSLPSPGTQLGRGSGTTPTDKELNERKLKSEQAQAAQRKAEEVRALQVKAENCERAKLAKRNLDSGVRLSRLNQAGEREIMDDAVRATETRRMEAIIATECQ